MTETDAFEAMLAHHRNLEKQVGERAAAVAGATASASGTRGPGGSYPLAVADLVAHFNEEVLPHATAEEQSIYLAAIAVPALEKTVAELLLEHEQLTASVQALAAAEEPTEVAAMASSIAALFSAHVAKENDLVLARLQAEETISLTDLLAQMHELTDTARTHPPADGDAAGARNIAPVSSASTAPDRTVATT
jgi:iron-sulfur cluster repair protein YtfE (RIC family)